MRPHYAAISPSDVSPIRIVGLLGRAAVSPGAFRSPRPLSSRSLSRQITDEPPELRLPLLEHLCPAWAVSFSAIPQDDSDDRSHGGGSGGDGGGQAWEGGAGGSGGGAACGSGGGEEGCFLYRCIKAS